MSDFDFKPSAKAKPGRSGDSRKLMIVGGVIGCAALVFFALAGIGLTAFLMTRGREVGTAKDAGPTAQAPTKQPDQQKPKKDQIAKEQGIVKPTSKPDNGKREEEIRKEAERKRAAAKLLKVQEEQRKQDAEQKWQLETRREYLEAIRIRGDRMRADALRLGSLTRGQFKLATAHFKRIKAIGDDPANISKIDRAGNVVIANAMEIDPRYVRAVLREHGLRLLAKMGKNSEKPRLSWGERRTLHGEFATLIGEPERPWDLSVAFDDLNAKEMGELIAALRQCQADGFRSLSKYQRLLILDAGAVEFFRQQAGINEK